MKSRHLSAIDHLITHADRALRTLTPGTRPAYHTSPAEGIDVEQALTDEERRKACGLMRVNHTGEVCAQALYQGQALTAKLPDVRSEMEKAADEEIDHLAWCEERIDQLGGRVSILNPIWYTLSYGIGASAGLISDKMSLGFVAATEDQVCKHLESHLNQLPAQDAKSRAIVTQMLEDEASHASHALQAGGYTFPRPIKKMMSAVAKVMTTTSEKV
ncbi:2-polyprenyl-3-methyl-6-methoxy-1,4-benzoquinone monooxygenase [Marinibactrum halimedae]|uniref:3-demethoxyubiquinol 3-hydroxylase n=1 Tax=Marinibactrum halimedae TaxID=1444977 RepID=A0AA37T4T9_9GAMM|nr:2-polyprenyl-3-methyl-6-methoxy-1,4-benzoquinone monooxygenase [Marinibactrum halimedae]MCD9459932.1 2-polyprenyl-3-methyl-6-methoxy-1,4-benzoquinone monooxygenase [Marinibactrum halimedae]GLS25213.1 2-nonaprenyl-3-methyl-6-methoxy-1,4-benzoquinol hydroxylase [Marinibactrum halimedae]